MHMYKGFFQKIFWHSFSLNAVVKKEKEYWLYSLLFHECRSLIKRFTSL